MEGLTKEQRRILVREATELAATYSIQVVPAKQAPQLCEKTGKSIVSFRLCPLSIIPAPFPKHVFQQTMSTQLEIAQLFDGIARHPTFLRDRLASTAGVDSFLQRTLELYTTVIDSNPAHYRDSIMACAFRTDYMLHESSPGTIVPKNVEINTIAAGLGAVASRAADFYDNLFQGKLKFSNLTSTDGLESNDAVGGIVHSFKASTSIHLKCKTCGILMHHPAEWCTCL
eukprot:m.308138 g.308138  ORF g.308138 m.308138 type:complete len:228 (+) comp15939_c2_seq9:177-860(+)